MIDEAFIESLELARTLGANSQRTNACLDIIAQLRADLTRAREENERMKGEVARVTECADDAYTRGKEQGTKAGRESMREDAAESINRKADALTRCGSFIAVATFRAIASDIRAIPTKEGKC